jgi:hypothetical protein
MGGDDVVVFVDARKRVVIALEQRPAATDRTCTTAPSDDVDTFLRGFSDPEPRNELIDRIGQREILIAPYRG